MQVRFKALPDPKNSEGFLVTFETVGGLVHDTSPLTATFRTKFDLDSAFMAAGIYLRDLTHSDPERGALPDPDRNYEVSAEALGTIGFDIPK